MNDIHLYDINKLHFLWLLILFGGLYFFAWRRRRQILARFTAPVGVTLSHLTVRAPHTAGNRRKFWKLTAFLIGVTFLVLGLTRPAWNLQETTINRSGRDVVFAVDVSRSMLAEDLAPNRLERAKIAIKDAVEKLQGDRVALVAFSGTASVLCPLTSDYGFFRMMLERLSPASVSRGGTMIGDAVRLISDEVLDSQDRQFKDVILITDGGDQESFPVEAAKAAGEKGVRLIIIGLGDEHEGRRIPITDEQGRKTFLKYQGREVWTKLDADVLRDMAKATPGGRYLPVSVGNVDLGEVYMDLVANAEKRQIEETTIKKYEEKFQIFLAAALFFLALELLINERRQGNA